jgi:hypothetical protein
MRIEQPMCAHPIGSEGMWPIKVNKWPLLPGLCLVTHVTTACEARHCAV